jgi:L-asparaginase II
VSTDQGVVLAVAERSGFSENSYRGSIIVLHPDGSVADMWGAQPRMILPRSSNKIGQATAMVGAGFDGPDEFIALAAASHSGSDMHLAWLDRMLEAYELPVSALQTPPDLPLGTPERNEWIRDQRSPEPRAMNCSGKHAAMLATCVINGWPLPSYLEPEHPLQRLIAHAIAERAEEPIGLVGVDGCGAPVFGLTMRGLARMAQRVALEVDGTPDARVAVAMRRHPDIVGGQGRDATLFMSEVPGLLAKDGADGVYVGVDPNGFAFAVKIDDGNLRARNVVVAGILSTLGWDVTLPDSESVILGGGRPVGRIRAMLG